MTILATDAFTRANAGTLGANWTDIDAGWGIVSNAADCTPASLVYSSRYTGVSFPNDQWGQVTITGAAETTSDQGSGIILRASAGGNLILCQGNTVETKIYERIASVFTLKGTGAAIALNDILYFEVRGNALVLRKGGSAGTILISATGSGNVTAGNVGLWSAPVSVHGNVDTFSAGDFPTIGGFMTMGAG